MSRKTAQKRDGVYQRKDRPGFWITWVDAQGRRRQRKTDAQNITQAKAIRSAELTRVEQARILGHNPPGKDTFKEVADRYLKYQKARLSPDAYTREEGILRKHLARFDSLPLASLRKADIQHYVTERAAKKVAAATVQRELVLLKHLFSLAVEWELIPVNPAQFVKAPKLPAGRTRYLQPTELRALLGVCPDGLRQIVALAVSTGMRRGEILNLRYLDVDLTNRRVMLPQTKNGEGRVVYLNDQAMMVFNSWPQGAPGDRVFAEWTGPRVSDAFERARGKVKLVDFRFHDLRHTAASWMRMTGSDIHTVAKVLGHKDLRMTDRYSHLSPAFLAEAVGKLDAIFGPNEVANRGENGGERYQDVTAKLALGQGSDASGEDT